MICFHKLLEPCDGDASVAVENGKYVIGKNVPIVIQSVRDKKSKWKWRRSVCG
jgi:hypothetical protein